MSELSWEWLLGLKLKQDTDPKLYLVENIIDKNWIFNTEWFGNIDSLGVWLRTSFYAFLVSENMMKYCLFCQYLSRVKIVCVLATK